MLTSIKFNMEYRENRGMFHTDKRVNVYFSCIEPEDTHSHIMGIIDAVIKEVPKMLKEDYRPIMTISGTDTHYNTIEGMRYCFDTWNASIAYRKWVGNCYDVDREERYIGKNGMNKSAMTKALRKQMEQDVMDLLFQHGRVEYAPI